MAVCKAVPQGDGESHAFGRAARRPHRQDRRRDDSLPAGQEHLIYFQGSEATRVTCDERGQATLRCFQTGDQAEVYVHAPGGDWKPYEVKIGEAGATVDLSIAAKPVSSGSVTLTNATR